MTNSTLKSLTEILALLALTRQGSDFTIEKNQIISFLQNQFSNEIVVKYTSLFEEFYKSTNKTKQNYSNQENKILLKIDAISGEIYKSLTFKQRLYILISLFEFSKYLKEHLEEADLQKEFYGYIERISNNFKIEKQTHDNIREFCRNNFHLLSNKTELLIVSGEELKFTKINNLVVKNLQGLIYIFKAHPDFYIIKHIGKDMLFIDNRIIKSESIYFFNLSSTLQINKNQSVYFNELRKIYNTNSDRHKIVFTAKDIEFSFKNSTNGIKQFSIACESNEMIGIIGSSGSGKTTLLSILNGTLKAQKGEILINNTPLTKQHIKEGLIGYVPQNDLLIEELSVFENLYLNSRLCLNIDRQDIIDKTNNLLETLELQKIQNLKIGTPIKKVISGGQRKRLNLALELIREPDILIIDEPTSGLSSTDSFKIIYLLKQQALNNKILFISIHQPSDAILNLFDKILIIDFGGYPIFYGRPKEALHYFQNLSKKIAHQSNENQNDVEQILTLIEESYLDESGNNTSVRLIKPEEWYNHYQKQNPFTEINKDINTNQPKRDFKLPNSFRQFITYTNRNVKSKLADIQFQIIALIISPLLAIILSFLTKEFTHKDTGKFYLLSENDNIPSFYFMSIIVVIFVGLMVSAEDIYKDKKLFVREGFLNLNKYSYYFSKISFLIVLSLFQTLVYVFISVLILKINTNLFVFWLTLFLLSVLSNTAGLIISELLNSLVAIYILIPIIIIPQILLSGVVVKYEKLNPLITSTEFVPVIGDLMPTRWGYETLLVNQFKNNKYQKIIFDTEQKESIISFIVYQQIPQIQILIDEMLNNELDSNKKEMHFNFILNETNNISVKTSNFLILPSSTIKSNEQSLAATLIYLKNLKKILGKHLQTLINEKHQLLAKKYSSEQIKELKENNYNSATADIVLNNNTSNPLIIYNNRIIQKVSPIYSLPSNNFGRTPYCASSKKIHNFVFSSIHFNSIMLIIMILINVLLLIFEIPKKIIMYPFKTGRMNQS